MSTDKNNEIELILTRLKFIKHFNTWKDVAAYLGVSEATLSIWKRRNSPSAKEKILFRSRGDVEESFLLSGEGVLKNNLLGNNQKESESASRSYDEKFGTSLNPKNFGPPPHQSRPPNRIPLISWVQAGGWKDVEDPFQPGQADEWLLTTETSSPHAFALTVQGDSMEPEFLQNDIITVDPDQDALNGSFVIAKNGNEATFKQLVIDGSSVFLKPLNERYPIKDMTDVHFHIVGVVVEKKKRYR